MDHSCVSKFSKPLPMKLFSTWEVENSSPSCITRLCCLRLTRLVVLTSLESESSLHSIVIAIKMQRSKRTLRSNELILQPNGLLDTDIDLSFSLQYLHYLKRDVNRLQVMLQRRKKYKNRAILGYKTLAVGYINLTQIIQQPIDLELELLGKEKNVVTGKVVVLSLISQPADHDERSHITSVEPDRSPLEASDDECNDDDYSTNEDTTDLEPASADPMHRRRKSRNMKALLTTRQRNLKQKFISMLRRFKVTEEVLEEAVKDLGNDSLVSRNVFEADDLFEEVENLTEESENDIDNMSIQSTPKPKLTPFFSTANSGSVFKENVTINGTKQEVIDQDIVQPSMDQNRLRSHSVIDNNFSIFTNQLSHKYVGRRCSYSILEGAPKRNFLDQVSVLNSDAPIDGVLLTNHLDTLSQILLPQLQLLKLRTLVTASVADIKSVINSIMNRIQKFLNKSSMSNTVAFKVGIIGNDMYISSIVRPFVEILSTKSTDWINYFRFLVIPFGTSAIARNISSFDTRYANLFNDVTWRELTNIHEKVEYTNRSGFNALDISEINSRISRYIGLANQLLQLPLSEAILTNKERGSDEASQLVVPFIGEVRLGLMDLSSSNLFSSMIENDDAPANYELKSRDSITCPTIALPPHVGPIDTPTSDSFDLQVDYWVWSTKSELGEKNLAVSVAKKEVKCSLKTMFRLMQIQRMHGADSSALNMAVVTREKKQKIMRIGKKGRDGEVDKSQQIEGINRLICTSKSQHHPLNVSIDGMEWNGVKFFQVSAQWQTHVKYFPVLIFGSVYDTGLGQSLVK